MNAIVCGDCEKWLKQIPSNSVDLIYIDPPFYSKRTYEQIWGNGYEKRSFDDRWRGKSLSYYANWMKVKCQEAKRILKPTGSMLLHCDHHANHYLRMMMDDMFGYKNFINELIWSYFKPHSSTKTFPRSHDTIYWYSKTRDKYTFIKKDSLEPYDKKAIARYDKIDKNGRRYKIYNNKDKQRIAYMNGGKPVDIFKIPFIQGNSKERIGYPTQKPEALLDILLKACSNQGDLVLDFFGGGGTTAAVCWKTGRKFITGDVSPVACKVMASRLKKLRCTFDLIGM